MSYQSTPNSAEIVVRKHVVESESSDDEQDEYEHADDTSTDPSTDDPLVKKEGRPVALTVSTSMDDEERDFDKIESFSPPRFDNIENVTSSYSTSPAANDIALPSDKDRRFKKCDEPFSHEELSAITEPSFGASPNQLNVAQQENNQEAPKQRDVPAQNSDPLGHYWGPGLAPVDPFAKPFFQDQASDVTSPVHNLSHFAAEALEQTRPNHVGPEDEIEANRSHDTEEGESKNVKARTPTRKGGEERRQLVIQVQKLIEEARRTDDKIENKPGVKASVRTVARNQIADKRVELIERRKMIEEKVKSEGGGRERRRPSLRPLNRR